LKNHARHLYTRGGDDGSNRRRYCVPAQKLRHPHTGGGAVRITWNPSLMLQNQKPNIPPPPMPTPSNLLLAASELLMKSSVILLAASLATYALRRLSTALHVTSRRVALIGMSRRSLETRMLATIYPEAPVRTDQEVGSRQMLLFGHHMLVGTFNPPGANGVNDRADTGRTWLLFVRATPDEP